MRRPLRLPLAPAPPLSIGTAVTLGFVAGTRSCPLRGPAETLSFSPRLLANPVRAPPPSVLSHGDAMSTVTRIVYVPSGPHYLAALMLESRLTESEQLVRNLVYHRGKCPPLSFLFRGRRWSDREPGRRFSVGRGPQDGFPALESWGTRAPETRSPGGEGGPRNERAGGRG